MKIVGVTMVKDEEDIIGTTITNLLEQGIDHIIAADNLSSDHTRTILESFSEVTVIADEEVGYYQSDKITNLAKVAFAEGADWVVPFDADEIWRVRGGTVRAELEACDGQICAFPLFNYFPTAKDDRLGSPFERISHHDVRAAPLPKVAVQYAGDLRIEQGNHSASGSNLRLVNSANGFIGHFPWRGFRSFKRKIENGYKAYKATDLPQNMGGHWRSYGELLFEHGEEALRSWYYQWFEDPPDVELVNEPVFSVK